MAAVLLSTYDFRRLSLLVEKHLDSPCRGKSVLSRLQEKLENALVVAPERIPPDVVTLYSCVRVIDLESRRRSIFTLVFPGETVPGETASGRKTPVETTPGERRISVLAPMGVALVGARIGARVECRGPERTLRLKIEELLYQPEAAGALYA